MKSGKKKKVGSQFVVIPEIDIKIEVIKKKKTLKGKSTKKKPPSFPAPFYWNGTTADWGESRRRGPKATTGYTTSGWYYFKRWLHVAGPFATQTKAKNARRKQSLTE